MKTASHYLAAAALAFAGAPALAQAQTPAERADVKAETKAANKNGGLHTGSQSPNPQGKLQTAKTRADRKAETNALASQGKLDQRGEAGGQPTSVPRGTSDRQQVKADTKAAVRTGAIPSGELGTVK